MAAATVVSPRISPQAPTPRLVVRTMPVLKYRWETTETALMPPRLVAVDSRVRRLPAVWACVEAHGGGPASFDRGAVAAGGQIRGGGEVGAVAGVCGSPGESNTEVRWVLPVPGGPMSRMLVADSR